MTQRKESGLSMIELLIALVLSSLLILGATQIYIDNRNTYLFQQGQSDIAENGRYALLMLERQLGKTGYRRRPNDNFEFAFPAATDAATGCQFTAGETIVKVSDTSLCLRYQPRDDTERDCSNQSPSLTGNLDTPYGSFNEFLVERISISDEELTCNDALLASGVTAVRFDFGVGPAGVREVDNYTNSPSTPIRSMRYALLLASDRGSRQGMTSQAYEDWHGSAPTDNRLYHVISSSMTLRNMMP